MTKYKKLVKKRSLRYNNCKTHRRKGRKAGAGGTWRRRIGNLFTRRTKIHPHPVGRGVEPTYIRHETGFKGVVPSYNGEVEERTVSRMKPGRLPYSLSYRTNTSEDEKSLPPSYESLMEREEEAADKRRAKEALDAAIRQALAEESSGDD